MDSEMVIAVNSLIHLLQIVFLLCYCRYDSVVKD